KRSGNKGSCTRRAELTLAYSATATNGCWRFTHGSRERRRINRVISIAQRTAQKQCGPARLEPFRHIGPINCPGQGQKTLAIGHFHRVHTDAPCIGKGTIDLKSGAFAAKEKMRKAFRTKATQDIAGVIGFQQKKRNTASALA